MGAFRLDDRRMALVRNHELTPRHRDDGPFGSSAPRDLAVFDRGAQGQPLPGGTTTIIFNR